MKYIKFLSIAVALLLLGAGSADAQTCFAQVQDANTVRAEGLTEVVGKVRVLCRRPAATDTNPFVGAIPTKFTVALELNTRITNTIVSSNRVVQPATMSAGGPPVVTANPYTDGGITLVGQDLGTGGVIDAAGGPIDATAFGGGKLSSDGTTITWTLYTEDDDETAAVDESERDINLDPGTAAEEGFLLTISGIRANAAMRGNGEDIEANVLIGGVAVNTSPMKLADVSTGITLDIGAKTGLQCNKSTETSRVTIKEGYATAWMAKPFARGADDNATPSGDAGETEAYSDTFVLNISNVPEGVTVEVPTKVDLEADKKDGGVNEMLGSVAVDLVTGRTSGVSNAGVVSLSNTGAGQVRYKIRTIDEVDASDGPDGVADTDDDVEAVAASSTVQDDLLEWVHVPITFKWNAGAPDLAAVDVNVGFHPMSDHGGDTFMRGGAAVPRFSEDGADAAAVLTIKDCMTTLFYPFVTSSSGYDTGIVVSNTSKVAGDCSATFSGAEDSMDLGEVMPGMQSIFLVSSHMEDFSGYLEVVCDLQSASGFAHVVDSSGLAGSQGYIAQCDSVNASACK